MSRKKTNEIVRSVRVDDAGAEGKAIVHNDGMVVFVPFVVPGDIIDLLIYKKKKRFAEGKALALIAPSELRRDAACPHFGVCGGCKWQTMDYNAQLKYKEQQVRDNLERLGHIDTKTMRPICGSEQTLRYRNKLEFTFSTKRWLQDGEERGEGEHGALGFHAPTVFDKVIPIEQCVLQPEPSNAIRNWVRRYAEQHGLPYYDIRNHTGYMRNLVLRCNSIGEWMVILIVADDREDWLLPMLEELHIAFPEISSLQYIINKKMNDSYNDLDVKTYYGEDHITEMMPRYWGGSDLEFRINAKSFYQTNSRQAHRLYSYVAELANLQGNETLYDLYTGTGTIAQFLAQRCKKVVGIEYVEEAIADARCNAEQNGCSNCSFFAGDMAKVLTDSFVAENGRPDVVVTDPPRAGMHEKVVEQLLKIEAKKIVYVSCNPATQARDLAMMAEKYQVRCIQPVDMFPHTHHVENVVLLELKK